MRTTSLPSWLKTKISFNEKYRRTSNLIKEFDLHTVCQGAGCPNRSGCFSQGTATFMILGDTCTRNCRFCGVTKGEPALLDPGEPDRIAQAVTSLALEYIVITSVTRDDLPDGGAAVFAEVINCIRKKNPKVVVEILTPDFGGDRKAITVIAEARPEVFNHNLETIARLYPQVRPEADYHRSLNLLAEIKKLQPGVKTKSGLMVGLGENSSELITVLNDLRAVGCDFITIGQYLAPSAKHLPVVKFIRPEQFEAYERIARDIGFTGVACAPLVRSSYRAKEMYLGIGESGLSQLETVDSSQ